MKSDAVKSLTGATTPALRGESPAMHPVAQKTLSSQALSTGAHGRFPTAAGASQGSGGAGSSGFNSGSGHGKGAQRQVSNTGSS